MSAHYINHLQNDSTCIQRELYMQIRNHIYKMRIEGSDIFFSHKSLLIQSDYPTQHYIELNPLFSVWNIVFSFFIDISNESFRWHRISLSCYLYGLWDDR